MSGRGMSHLRLGVWMLILLGVLAGYGVLAQSRASRNPPLIKGSMRYSSSANQAPLGTISGGALPSEARGKSMAAGLLPSERRGAYLKTGQRPFGNVSGTIRYGGSRRFGSTPRRPPSAVQQWAGSGRRAGPATRSLSQTLARPIGSSLPGSIRYGGGGGGGYARGGGYATRRTGSSGSYFARPIGGTIRYNR